MSTVRRWYIVLVTAISLQAVTWAVIALLRNVLGVRGSISVEGAAFEIAVIVIGLPIYLIHWIWAQRLAARDREEREAPLRCVYLYATLAAFLIPWTVSAYELSRGLLGLLLDAGAGWQGSAWQSISQGLLGELSALFVLGALWFYHRQVLRTERWSAGAFEHANALVRRVYLLGLSAGGLLTTAQAAAGVLRWLLYQIGNSATAAGASTLINPLAALVVGLPLWVLHWRQAQLLVHGPDEVERRSALRRVYLYAVEFFSVLTLVSGLTLMLAGLLRQLLGLAPEGDIRDPLPVVLISALIWAYHWWVLRSDAALMVEAPRQAEARRISWYLLASIGLFAMLVGLGGVVSVLLRATATPTFDTALREQLAWSMAALIAGLPLWAIVWRQAQGLAMLDGPAGDAERGALVRRIYLYGFLFVATLTILSGLVYIVFRVLSVLLGEGSPDRLLVDLAQAIAFSGIAAGVLAYHGGILRAEGRRRQAAEAQRAAALHVAVLDPGDGVFGRFLIAQLRQELPDLTISSIGVEPAGGEGEDKARDPASRLAAANLIVGPWQIAVPQFADAELARAVAASPARKLLLPMPAAGWDWAGVEPWDAEEASAQVVHALRQVISGEPIRPQRPLPPLALFGLVLGVILLIIIVLVVVVNIVAMVLM